MGPTFNSSQLNSKMSRKIVLIDMDGVLVDEPDPARVKLFTDGVARLTGQEWKHHWSDILGIFRDLPPFPGGIEALCQLYDDSNFDVFICSTAPWANDSAWSDKVEWIKRHVPRDMKGRVILTHRKDLVAASCDYIIDDRRKNGVENVPPEKHIHFGQPPFENWNKIIDFLQKKL